MKDQRQQEFHAYEVPLDVDEPRKEQEEEVEMAQEAQPESKKSTFQPTQSYQQEPEPEAPVDEENDPPLLEGIEIPQ